MDIGVAISVGFAGVALAAFVALCAMRHWYCQRSSELDLALDELRTFVGAVEVLESDPRTPQAIKRFVETTTFVMAHHRIVGSVAKQIADEFNPSRPSSASARQVMASLRELEVSAPELADQVKTVMASGLIAMMLRWPETRRLALKIAAKTSDATFVEASSAKIMDAAPPYLPAAA